MAVIEEIVENEDEMLLAKAEGLKMEGNTEFGKGEWTSAKDKYQEALDTCPESAAEQRAPIYANLSAALIKLEQWEAAATAADSAIQAGYPNEKALERRAFARSKQDDKVDAALEDYTTLAQKFPSRADYARHIVDLRARIDARNEQMKADVLDKLKGLGNMCLKPFGLSTDSFQMTPNGEGGYSISMKNASKTEE